MADWRKLFAPAKDHSLDFFSPTILDGIHIVTPPKEVFEEGISTWKNSVVAQFLGKPPAFTVIQRTLTKLWEKRGNTRINFAGQNLYTLCH